MGFEGGFALLVVHSVLLRLVGARFFVDVVSREQRILAVGLDCVEPVVACAFDAEDVELVLDFVVVDRDFVLRASFEVELAEAFGPCEKDSPEVVDYEVVG